MTNSTYGSDGLPEVERRIYTALCKPGTWTEGAVAMATDLTPEEVREGLQGLLARYYIHVLPAGEYIVR
jgi:hypothetical protein